MTQVNLLSQSSFQPRIARSSHKLCWTSVIFQQIERSKELDVLKQKFTPIFASKVYYPCQAS